MQVWNGIIAEHYPDLQMVSFGPDIQGHMRQVNELSRYGRKCWKLVTALEAVK